MSSSITTERTRQFLEFLHRVRDDHDKGHNMDTEIRNTIEDKSVTPTGAEEQALRKKLNHMTRLTTALEKSLSDKQTRLQQKQAKAKSFSIDWEQAACVSKELEAALDSYDCKHIQNSSHQMLLSTENFLAAESQLQKHLLSNASEAYSQVINDKSGGYSTCARNAVSDRLLEAKAAVRFLEYKKSIETQQTTFRKEINDNHFQTSVVDMDRHQVMEEVKSSETDIKNLREKLRSVVAERLSVEKEISTSRHQHQQIVNLRTVIDILNHTIAQLDQQAVRYGTIQISTETDTKIFSNLHDRATVIEQLLKNDEKSTNKMKELISFEARGDYCPSQQKRDQIIDKRDKLLNNLKDILLPATELSKQGVSKNNSGISVNCLAQAAEDCKLSCERKMDTLTDPLLAVERSVQRSEAQFATLVADCKRVHEASHSSVTPEQLRRHCKHKSKVTALLSDLKIKVDTRYDHWR
jgi:hypothetical protein